MKKAQAQKIEQPIAQFDFARRVAFMHLEGARVESIEWFRARPDMGDKSPTHINFRIDSKTVVARLHGIWPGALEIGTTSEKKPANAPV